MSLRMVLGPARSGKTALFLSELAEKDPMSRVFYIVPEQMTLSSQQKLLEAVPGHGVMNTEVLSFNRLAHRIFEEVGMPAQTVLDDMGKSLLLYRIAGEHRAELVYYGHSTGQSGFIGQLKLMVTEMLQYCLTEEDIRRKLESVPKESVLAKKWQDILLLYAYYNEEISDKQISSEQLLDLFAERLDQSGTVSEAEFYFDEFSGFTPQQYRVLEGLARRAKRVSIALSLSERAYYGAVSAGDPKELGRSVFAETQKSFLKIAEMSKRLGLPLELELLPLRPGANVNERALERLREGLFSLSEVALSPAEAPLQQAVFASVYPVESDELQALMHEILHLVREEGCRLKDIAVLDANFEERASALRRQLDLYGINAYLDNKTAVTAHPFAQLVLSLWAAVSSGFSLADSVSIFKTGLSPLSIEQVDVLENELLARGCRGAGKLCACLSAHEEWPEAASCAASLASFAEACRTEENVSGRSRALLTLLLAWGVRERMDERAIASTRQAEHLPTPGASPAVYLRRAAEYAQLWERFEEILARMNDFLGNMPISSGDYYGLLSVALSQCRLSTVPPSMDQLLVGDLFRTHLTEEKIIFVTGFTEGAFPGNTDNPGLFNRKERADMRKLLEMAPDSSENIMLRYFSLYTLLGKASERVYFSCSLGNAEGAAVPPALQWNRMKKISGAKGWPRREEPTLPYPTLSEKGTELPPEALSWLRGNGFEALLEGMNNAGQLMRQQEKLKKNHVKQLLKRYHSFSVSQAECYANCPFSYYMRYLLRLEEREEPRVRRLEDGTVLHDVLEASGEWFRLLWGNTSEEAVSPESLAHDLFAQKEENPEYSVYCTSARYRFYWEKLERSAAEALGLIREQLSVTDFCPSEFEWEFGGHEVGPITLSLSDGEELHFRGKIDRIDVLNTEDGHYIRIIDYKSGRKSFDEKALLAGTQLQLPIYMEAALEKWGDGQAMSGENRPAGFFYFHLVPEDSANAKLNGLMLKESLILDKMDRVLAEQGKAQSLPVSYNKDGSLSSRSGKFASQEQFRELGRFARMKAAESFEAIERGDMQASPLESACSYCEFAGICSYDPIEEGVRELPKDTLDFWASVRTYLENNEESK